MSVHKMMLGHPTYIDTKEKKCLQFQLQTIFFIYSGPEIWVVVYKPLTLINKV